MLGRGVSGQELSKLEDAWLPLLQSFPWGQAQAEALRERGRILFGIGARLLGGKAEDALTAGALWSLVDGANHCSDAASRDFLLYEARMLALKVPRKFPREIRPLTVLAALAANDLRRSGRVGRVGAALVHRLRGTLPRS